MNNPSFNPRSGEEEPLAGIIRLIRQACVLREQGDAGGAVRLRENEVATAIRDFRLARGPEALPESELQAMYAAEERRVAEAAILSELLVPRLLGALPAAPARGAAGLNPVVRPTSAAVGAVAVPAGPPAIPDLLDAMLAAERTSRRPAATVPSGT